MKYFFQIFILMSVLLISSCGTQEVKTPKIVQDNNTEAEGEKTDKIINNEEENIEIELLKVVDILFTKVELVELSYEEPKDSWEYIQSISLGNIQDQSVTLHVYQETNENNRCSFSYETVSLIEFDDKSYQISECTSVSFLEEDPESIQSFYKLNHLYQQKESNQILHSAVELSANGPGRLLYLVYDLSSEKWLSFGSWGIPNLIDLDQSGDLELVNQFPGLHMSMPDATIYRWSNGHLEVSSKLKDVLGITKKYQNQVMVQLNEKEGLFEVSILSMQTGEITKIIKYRYENEKLYAKD